MNAMQFAGFAVCAAAMALVIRRLRPEIGSMLSMAAGGVAALLVLPLLSGILDDIASLAEAGSVPDGYMKQLFKVAGVSLLMDFAAQTCRDAGEEGLAQKTELAGRVMLIGMALPAMRTMFDQIMSLSP